MSTFQGDYWSGLYQQSYEADIIEEARSIVAGEVNQPPTVEHLRVLLSWLDGCQSVPADAAPPF